MDDQPRHLGFRIQNLARSEPNTLCAAIGDEQLTRHKFGLSAANLVSQFKEQHVREGDVVAILPSNSLFGAQCALALWALRAAVVFLDPRQSKIDIDTVCKSAGVAKRFSDLPTFSRRDEFERIVDNVNYGAVRMNFDHCNPDDIAIVLTSSGTTSAPRIRKVSHARLLSRINDVNLTIGFDPTDKSARLLVGSLAFGAVSFGWLRWLMLGVPIWSVPTFYQPKDVDRVLSRPDVTAGSLSPAALRKLIEFNLSQEPTSPKPAYPHLRQLRTVGGPASIEDLRAAKETLTPNVENLYSLTGVGPVSILSGKDLDKKGGSVGKPFEAVSVRILTSNGKTAKIGVAGRVFARNKLLDSDEEIETGDNGYLDEDGYLFLTGRSEQNATRNSINLNLSTLEADIKEISDVRDCIAFATQTQRSSDDVVHLAIESDLDLDTLKASLRERLSSYELPDRVLLQRVLPRNASEKLSLRELQALAQNQGGPFVDF